MKTNRKIENLKNIILARVKFHAPVLYGEKIDYEYLESAGIKTKYPVFYFEKNLSKDILKAFKLALSECKFNLVLSLDQAIKFRPRTLFDMENLILLDKKTASLRLINEINKANINYYSSTNYKQGFCENFIKIDQKTLNLSQKDYYFEDFGRISGIYYNVKEFLLDGKNYLFKFNNPQNCNANASIEFNYVLPMGYYSFSHDGQSVKAYNLTNKKTYFLNFNLRVKSFSFSCVEGLENSRLARINVVLNLGLKPKEHKAFIINFGEHKLKFSGIDYDNYFELAQKKINEFFDFKLCTNDIELDKKINKILPEKIFLSWSSFSRNEEAENEYLDIRSKFIRKNGDKILFDCPQNLTLRNLEIYLLGEFKRVNVYKSEEKTMSIGGVKFTNLSCISQKLFKKNKEIYLSFGT